MKAMPFTRYESCVKQCVREQTKKETNLVSDVNRSIKY